MKPLLIRRVLVANRGEIACRILRTLKAMGIASVAVHSDIDRQARHSREADSRVGLGGSESRDNYLAIDKIVAAALTSGAQAIHPGYGFLSENADFARAIEAAGLVFIGPPAAAIDAMGSKAAAKALMAAAGVPVVPGYHGERQDLATFQTAAQRMGYPLLLKAVAGGGGKGMKVVEAASQLAEALESARREAQAAFGDARLLLEKYLEAPRHVEVQVFADAHGHCLYLGERDCSLQRRHQKVVEEAPAPGLAPALRRAMGEAAVRAAQAVGYIGAGTVEFLLDRQGNYFFMEMNTRLQVEHPVTEAITGLDLVAWQIRVAQGEPLPIAQDQVALRGHAIEVRLYAEDPSQDFLPASGRLALYREPPLGPGQRVDSGIAEGDAVPTCYDPLLGKLIAWGEDREQARLRLSSLLEGFAIGGLKTNLAFLRRILAHPAFADARLDTSFIPSHAAQLLPAPMPLHDTFWPIAAQAWLDHQPAAGPDPWSARDGLRLGMAAQACLTLSCQGEARALNWSPGAHAPPHRAERRGDTLYLHWAGEWRAITQVDPLAARTRPAPAGGLLAPMNGCVVRVAVEPGQAVAAGTLLIALEAMKMEHSLRAPWDGRVKRLCARVGQQVTEGSLLVEMDEADGVGATLSDPPDR
jgi:3-methylcrotonyl-CoA carboxylase alpha subunit